MSARFEAIEALFHDALAQPEGERFAFVRQRANGDEDVEREVTSLLAAHVDATLTQGAIDRTDWIGKRVGPYRITSEIGRGGMGTIFLAIRDDDAFRKEVAVKVIKRGMDTDAIVRRFRTERQILADLDHPNIARLLDGGTTDDGLPFFVMEYIDGLPLDEYCRKHALDVRDRLNLFHAVSAAVAHAHERGVVHRDLKPSNILVTTTGVVKLLDFGIAKALLAETGEAPPTMTAAGQHVLTPAYASPEQIAGTAATPASDVYSLGVVLYELLTGRRPFDGSIEQIARAMRSSDPQRPSEATEPTGERKRIRRQLRGELDDVIMMALERDPSHRYADAGTLGADIARHLSGEPVRARRRSLWRRIPRRARRTSEVTAAIVAAIAIVFSLSPSFLKRGQPPAEQARFRRVAVLPFEQLGGSADRAYLGLRMADGVVARMRNLQGVTILPPSAVPKEASPGPAAAAEDLHADAVMTGRFQTTGDRLNLTVELFDAKAGVTRWRSRYAERLSNLAIVENSVAAQAAREIAPHVAQSTAAATPRTRNAEAEELYWKSRFIFAKANRTPEDIQRAIGYCERAVALDPSFAGAYATLSRGHELSATMLYAPPLEAFPKSQRAALKALEIDPSNAEAHAWFALSRWVLDHDWQAAEQHYKTALQLAPNESLIHQSYGEFLSAMGRHREALAENQIAMRLDPVAINAKMNRVLLLQFARQYDAAIELAEEILDLDATSYATIMHMASCYLKKGDIERAAELFKRANALSGGFYPDTCYLAALHWKLGRKNDFDAQMNTLDAMSANMWVDPMAYLTVYIHTGELQKAVDAAERAYEQRSYWIPFMAVNPHMDPLRSEPRFIALLDKLGLPPTVTALDGAR